MKIQKWFKKRIARTICSPPFGHAIAMVFRDRIPHKGFRIDTSAELIAEQTKAKIFWGNYESSEIRFVNRYLNKDIDVVELGCSIGVLSCHIRRLMSDSHQLICVEAFSDLAEIARANLSANSLSNKVAVIERAIDYNKKREFVEFEVGERSTGGRLASSNEQGSRSKIKTRTATLSEIANGFGNENYCLVSDIEGSEAGFIMAEKGALTRCRQIIIELHNTTYQNRRVTVEDMIQTLISVHGFVLIDQHGNCCVFDRPDAV